MDKLTELMEDILEESELTESQYLEFQHFRKLNEFVARQLLEFAPPPKDVFILRPQENFIEIILDKLGYRAETKSIHEITIDTHLEPAGSAPFPNIKLPEVKRNDYDVVLSMDILEHLLIHPKFFIERSKEMVKDNGLYIITCPNIARCGFRLKMLLGKNIYPWFDEEEYESSDKHISSSQIVRQFILPEAVQLVRDCNLRIKRQGFFLGSPAIETIPMSIGYYLLRHINYTAMRAIPFLRDAFYVMATANRDTAKKIRFAHST